MHHIYLIPGFFGFSNLGGISYFRAVREVLAENFHLAKLPVEIFSVKTLPTGSLRQRALRLLESVEQNKSLEKADSIHFIGHSTGGLDARLLASFATGIGRDDIREQLRRKLKTVFCLSTPHYGTPLASFFTTIYGKNLLYLVTLFSVVGLWRQPIKLAAGAFHLLSLIGDGLGISEPILRQLTDQLLRDFTPEREKEVRLFLNSVLRDVSLMVQLTPESMDVTNHALVPWPETRIVSYATVAPPPLQAIQKIRLKHLMTPLATIVYGTLYTLTSQQQEGYRYHPPLSVTELHTKDGLPFSLSPNDNDGVVPTLSQIYGEFRGYIRADHLDIVGHYLRGDKERQDGADWFMSGTRFDINAFEVLWSDITQVIRESLETTTNP